MATVVLAIVLLGVVAKKHFMGHETPTQAPRTTSQQAAAKNDDTQVSANPLHGAKLYIDPATPAATQAKAWHNSRPQQAALMDKLAGVSTARWFTTTASLDDLDTYLAHAKAAQAVPVLVAYNIPLRDCGKYSAGGAKNAGDYRAFIGTMAEKIGQQKVVVILEPDALAAVYSPNGDGGQCLNDDQRKMYYDVLKDAVAKLKRSTKAVVYLDAGHSAWVKDAGDMASRLQKAGIAQADGFSLNVSNFQTIADNLTYGVAISKIVGDKHFVIDTSRNGLGPFTNKAQPAYSWCNPPNRALGHFPTTTTEDPLVDAYLYIKYPGESDGQDADANKCFGGPRAGAWWPEYALGLISRWPADLQP